MEGSNKTTLVLSAVDFLSQLFIFIAGLLVLVIIVVYIRDVTQKKQAILRNYPVVGHFRYFFERLGEFFRQYFFAMDREELPFNRAQRSWVYRAAKNLDTTVAFGSTRDLHIPGTVIFVNTPFPTLDEDAVATQPVTIGPHCDKPYVAHSLFNISGMSFGAISTPAIRALSNGARMGKCWLNTGEGGLTPYHLEGGCDLVFQIGTAKYGVRNADGSLSEERLKEIGALENVRMFEIKLSQGAKPGKGGILPGVKVTEEIAGIRGIPVNEDSISPNRHREINSVKTMLDMIDTVRSLSGKPTGIKTVIGDVRWVEDLCKEIVLRGIESAPDFITIDSADGGTGAAPMALMDDVGLPLQESLPMVADKLAEFNLKGRIKVIASGKLITPTNVAWALCMGADFIVSARGYMFALGCIQAMQCNKNTCPTGITTHNIHLQKGLNPEDKAVRVAHYHDNMLREVGVIAHSCGVREPRELRRHHARLVTASGFTVPLSEIFPESRNVMDDQS